MRIRTNLRAAERRQDRARLAAPQIFPLKGDGLAARGVTAPLRGGPDSCLKRNRYGQWGQQFIVPTRSQLVAARYRDWIDARDAAIVAAAPRRTSYEVTPADEARAAMAGRSAAAAYLAGSSLG